MSCLNTIQELYKEAPIHCGDDAYSNDHKGRVSMHNQLLVGVAVNFEPIDNRK